MAKIMILAESGFGKTTSIGKNDKLGIKGLDPNETCIIQSSKKGLPFPGNKVQYTPIRKGEDGKLIGNLYYAKNSEIAIKIAENILTHMKHIKNIIFDDFNFYMQDYYMEESKNKKDNFKIFQGIGGQTSSFFDIFDKLSDEGLNVILLAHPEIYDDIDGNKRFKIKTVGNMVDKYVTPEGRFEIVLMGKASFNTETKKVSKQFVTNDDGQYNAKSPYGMFEELHIPNDLGYVLDCVNKFDLGE